ncbi:MAG: ribosome biogenesis GTPase Der [Cytophagales bacterium]|nr:ribosome biogenesis GTPase Der [Cytophagales bacterium]
MANILAIVGRPNVGKSTLFNRLIEKKQAIMDNASGVTRDRHYGQCEWNGKIFTVIDTGGYVEGSDDIFEEAIRSQVKEALEEASAIAFMVDCEVGLHALDQDFVAIIREIDKPIYIVANKADTPEKELNSSEFYALGLDAEILPVCSTSGSGTGDLLDKLVDHFEGEQESEKESLPKIAIVGRPNVGKSSFINALLGEERTIVTDVAGTTRDAIDTHYNRFGKDFMLTDTAGIRKKSKVHEDIEFYSVLRAIQAIQNSDVSVVMLDATQGLESQDMNIIGLSHKYKKGTIIMINKWDLFEKETQTAEEYRKFLQEKLGPLSYIPIIFTSVISKQRIFQAIELALKVYEDKTTKITTSQLNAKLLKDIERYPPPAVRGHYIKIKYITQLPTTGVTFAFFTNFPQYIKEAYQRYLTNKIRDHFGFEGVPITVVFRKK